MRTLLAGLAVGLVLVLAVGSLLAGAPSLTAASAGTVRASAVVFNLNYSDPASDVFILYTSNNSHVTDSAGNWLYSNTEPQVNILRIFSVDGGSNVGVYLRVQGGSAISDLPNTSYELHLYTRLDNSTHYILRYTNGTTTLRSNLTGSTVVNLTANTTISPAYQLGIIVAKADLGNITTWNIDATAKMVGAYYTFQDFGWLQPGNPGSAPCVIQGRGTDAATGAGSANATITTGPGGFTAASNATGYYVLPAEPGTFNLTFSQVGYVNLTRAVTITSEQTQTVNAALEKTVPPPSLPLWLVAVLLVVVVAVVAVVLVLLRRRRRPAPPAQ